jgi:hypothetical protein
MRAQLKHALIDVDFKDKPKIVDLQEIHGALARLLFIDCICLMSKSTSGGISRITIKSLGRAIGIKESACTEIITYCLNEEMFYEVNNLIFNTRVDKDQKKLQERRTNALERQKRYEEKRKDNASPTRLPDPVSVSDTEYINKNSTEIKILDFLYFDEISIDTWKAKLGTKGFERACEKLNGWIGQQKGSPDFQAALQKGKNASFTLQNWVARAVTNEPDSVKKNKKSATELLADMKFKEKLEGLQNG